MMAKKDRFPPSATSAPPNYESEGSGGSDHVEDSSPPTTMRKWIDLNSASRDAFSAMPTQTILLSGLSSLERRSLVSRLTSDLEQVRLVQNRIELRTKNAVNAVVVPSSNNKVRWKNAPTEVQVGNPKKSSALASGPGKKESVLSRSISGRFQSRRRNKGPANSNAGLLKQCESLLKRLMSQTHGWVFNTPVDVVKLNIPDYFDVIKSPMDLGTVKTKLGSGKYLSPLDFLADVRLTFGNAKIYNPPGTAVHNMADTMSQYFELGWKTIEKKMAVNTSQSLPKGSGIVGEIETDKPVPPLKKRKLSPARHEVIQEPIERKMTIEEKDKLKYELANFGDDIPDSIVNILREQSSSKGDDGEEQIPSKDDDGEDVIELDLDVLSDDILFTLRKLLDDHFLEKQKNPTKSEACEIELPNVSGLSNSSLQVDRGNDLLDEDVDIGGNEAPVTSYPPVVIEKDAGERAEECTEAGDIGQAESSDKLYRAAVLKKRFLDTILNAREKTLQDDKMDPEKLRHEKEQLEIHKKREKARLQAEAKAAEDARRKAEAVAKAEAKRRREIEREAAREALLKMEKTVELNECSRFIEDLAMLRAAATEELPASIDYASPDQSEDPFGSFKFGGSNPLEQLGLFMKVDEDDEEGEPLSVQNVTMDDAEEGEID